MTGHRSNFMTRGVNVLRQAIDTGVPFSDTMMTSIGVRVDRGPPRRLSAHDVIFKIGGISNRYDMWRRLMGRIDIAQQIMAHCEFLASDVHGRGYVPMLDGMGIMILMNALRGDSARIFRAECTTEFMRYMACGTIVSPDATATDASADDNTNTVITSVEHDTRIILEPAQAALHPSSIQPGCVAPDTATEDLARRMHMMEKCIGWLGGMNDEMKTLCAGNVCALMKHISEPV